MSWTLGVQFTNTSKTQNVDAFGVSSCGFCAISSVVNVFSLASEGVQWGSISNVEENVYCGAQRSCYLTVISNVNGNVISMAHRGAESANITNINGDVVALGASSLWEASITNVAKVTCDGDHACSGSSITNVSTIIAHDTSAIESATIISGGSDLFMKINGTMSTYEVYCDAGDVCTFICQSSDACSNMNLYCNGECYFPTGTPSVIPTCKYFTLIFSLGFAADL